MKMKRFFNHRELKIEIHEDHSIIQVEVENFEMGEMDKIRDISNRFEKMIKKTADIGKPLVLKIASKQKLNEEQILLLFNLGLYANIKSKDLIREEARLTVPEAIKNDKCSDLPLKQLINGTPYHNLYQIIIFSKKSKAKELF